MCLPFRWRGMLLTLEGAGIFLSGSPTSLVKFLHFPLGEVLYFPGAGVYICRFWRARIWGFPIGKKRLPGKQLNIIHTDALSHCFPINIDNNIFCQKKKPLKHCTITHPSSRTHFELKALWVMCNTESGHQIMHYLTQSMHYLMQSMHYLT